MNLYHLVTTWFLCHTCHYHTFTFVTNNNCNSFIICLAGGTYGSRLFLLYHGSCPAQFSGDRSQYDDCTRKSIRANELPHCPRSTRPVPEGHCSQPPDLSLASHIYVSPQYQGLSPTDGLDITPLTCPSPVDINNPNALPSNISVLFTSAPYTLTEQCKVDDICGTDLDQGTYSGSLVLASHAPRSSARLRLRSANYGEDTGGIGFRLWNLAPDDTDAARPPPSFSMSFSFIKGGPRLLLPSSRLAFQLPNEVPTLHPGPGHDYASDSVVDATITEGTRDITLWVNGAASFCRQFEDCLECHRHAATVGCRWQAGIHGLPSFCALSSPTTDPTITHCGCSEHFQKNTCLANGCQWCLVSLIPTADFVPRCFAVTARGRSMTPQGIAEPVCLASLRTYSSDVNGFTVSEPTQLPEEFQELVQYISYTYSLPLSLSDPIRSLTHLSTSSDIVLSPYNFQGGWSTACAQGCLNGIGGTWKTSLSGDQLNPPSSLNQNADIDDVLILERFNVTRTDRYYGHQYILTSHPIMGEGLLREYAFSVLIKYGVSERYPLGMILNHNGPTVRASRGGSAWSHYTLEWGMLKTTPCDSSSPEADYGKMRLIRHIYHTSSTDSRSRSQVIWEEQGQFPVDTEVRITVLVSDDDNAVYFAVMCQRTDISLEHSSSQVLRFIAKDDSPDRIVGGTVGLLSLGGIQSYFKPSRLIVRRRVFRNMNAKDGESRNVVKPGSYLLQLDTGGTPMPQPVLLTVMLFTQAALPPRDTKNMRIAAKLVAGATNTCLMHIATYDPVTGAAVHHPPYTTGYDLSRTAPLSLGPGDHIAVGVEGTSCTRIFVAVENEQPNGQSARIPYSTNDDHLWNCRRRDMATEPSFLSTLASIVDPNQPARRVVSSSPCAGCFIPSNHAPNIREANYHETSLHGIVIPYVGQTSVDYICFMTIPSFAAAYKVRVGSVTTDYQTLANAVQLHPTFGGGRYQQLAPYDLISLGYTFPLETMTTSIPTQVNYPAVYMGGADISPWTTNVKSFEARIEDMYMYSNVNTTIKALVSYEEDIVSTTYDSASTEPLRGFNDLGVALLSFTCPGAELRFRRSVIIHLPSFAQDLGVVAFATKTMDFALNSMRTSLETGRRFCQRIAGLTIQCRYAHIDAFLAESAIAYLAIYLFPSDKDTTGFPPMPVQVNTLTVEVVNDPPVPIVHGWPRSFVRSSFTQFVTVTIINVKSVSPSRWLLSSGFGLIFKDPSLYHLLLSLSLLMSTHTSFLLLFMLTYTI